MGLRLLVWPNWHLFLCQALHQTTYTDMTFCLNAPEKQLRQCVDFDLERVILKNPKRVHA